MDRPVEKEYEIQTVSQRKSENATSPANVRARASWGLGYIPVDRGNHSIGEVAKATTNLLAVEGNMISAASYVLVIPISIGSGVAIQRTVADRLNFEPGSGSAGKQSRREWKTCSELYLFHI